MTGSAPVMPASANFARSSSRWQEATVGGEVLAARQAVRAGDVAEARVEVVRGAVEALALAGVDDHVGGRVGGLVDRGEVLGRPRPHAEARRRPRRRLRLQRAVPGLDSAVEQRRLMTGGAQHPHQPRGHHAAGVVVGHDDVVVADPGVGHRGREVLGGRAAGGGRPRPGRCGRPAPRRGRRTRHPARGRRHRPRARRGRPGRSARRRRRRPRGSLRRRDRSRLHL